jgi:deoxyribose-phosphate aldolase
MSTPVDPSTAARARRAIGLVDLTDLDDRSTDAAVVALCARAAEHGTAAVCVWADFVARCAAELAGTQVRVATVVNFPTGDERAFAVGLVTDRALADGADDIDVVLPYRAFTAGDEVRAGAVLDAVRDRVMSPAIVKVILETGALPDTTTVERAAAFAIAHGADFVKTSTGKIPVSATLDAAEAMLRIVQRADRVVGLKPSGGIRTFDDAMAYLDLADRMMGDGWATPSTFRFGASGLLDALVAVAAGDPAGASPTTSDY